VAFHGANKRRVAADGQGGGARAGRTLKAVAEGFRLAIHATWQLAPLADLIWAHRAAATAVPCHIAENGTATLPELPTA